MTTGQVRSSLGETVDTLDKAAQLMRERAKDASRGPWRVRHHPDQHEGALTLYSNKGGGYLIRPDKHAGMFNHPDDAEHIASWHPDIALAVADWLELTALILPVGDDGGPFVLPGSTYEAALTVARAYLGETS